MRHVLAAFIILAAVTQATATTYWMSASGTNDSNCGDSNANACATYSFLMSGNNGVCGSDGCANNIVAGDTVNFVSGTYTCDGAGEGLGIPWNGAAGSPVTLQCVNSSGVYAPGTCTINMGACACSASGVGALAFNTQPGSVFPYSPSTITSYIDIKGLTLGGLPSAAGCYGIASDGGRAAHHILIKDVTITNAAQAGGTPLAWDPNDSFWTFVNLHMTQTCVNGATGCTFWQNADNVAVVHSTFDGLNMVGSGNVDCITMMSPVVGLIDGVVCDGPMRDGIDIGIDNAIPTPIDRMIRRYNIVSGVASRSYPASGQYPDLTGKGIDYKNVVKPATAAGGVERAFDYYGGIHTWSNWNNTVFTGTSSGFAGTFSIFTNDPGSKYANDIDIRQNLFDGTGTSEDKIAMQFGANVVSSCPEATADCPWVKNGIWYTEYTGSRCTSWRPSDTAYTEIPCSGFNTTWNTVGNNTGNFKANPNFVNRSQPQVLNNLQLTSSSTAYIDAGGTFCTATSGGTGNTIPVTCVGKAGTDPRYYFPEPAAFYGLTNDDCKGGGVRASDYDGANVGCFDFQIAGACGKRTITSMTSTSITFSGAPCTWANGAGVHVPWSGAAPDVGALEFDNSGATTTTTVTTTTTTTTIIGTTTTTTTTTSTTGTTIAAPNLRGVTLSGGKF